MSLDEDGVKNILTAFQKMGVNPHATTPDEFANWWAESTTMTTTQLRVINFSGDSKSDSTYDLWRYEVTCLMNSGRPQDQIMNAIRRSLRGEAARVMMRLGPTVTVKHLLEKMDSVYGLVDGKEKLFAEFYSAKQKPGETTSMWGCRLEDLLSKVAVFGEIKPEDYDSRLREMFWTGLRSDIKDVSGHLFNSSINFDGLRVAMRQVEKEISDRSREEKPKTANLAVHQPELDQLKAMVFKLSTDLAEVKQHLNGNQQSGVQHAATEGNQEHFNQRRQYNNNNGVRKCWNCGRQGHLSRDCRQGNEHTSRTRGDSWRRNRTAPEYRHY